MKRFLVLLCLVTFMTCSFVSVSSADIWGDLGNLFGGTSEEDDLPSFADAFEGDMVTVKVNGKKLKIHENFKNAMDQYEDFFDEYIAFMKNPDMLEYATFLTKYTKAMNALEGLEDQDMSDAELAYYTDVLLRIDKKLLAVVE